MPNSASAIVTAAEPISATFPARASKSGCRAANRNPNPLVARPGRGSGRRRRERRGQSAALRALDFGPVRAPDSRSATRARCGRDSEATADDRRAPAFLTDRTSLTPPPTSLPCADCGGAGTFRRRPALRGAEARRARGDLRDPRAMSSLVSELTCTISADVVC
jgi:hypothetical protein